MFNSYKGIITADMTKRHPLCSKMLKATHCLIAGATGSGKSVMMNSMIYTAIREQPNKFVFIDLKRTELKEYSKLWNCMAFCTEPENVIKTLDYVLDEMEYRYRKAKGRMYEGDALYVFIDELADLLDGTDKKLNEAALARIVKVGRLGRAAKIHLVCATQDPSRKCLSSALMKNFTCCLALRCKSDIDSRQIIGIAGAEDLPEYGQGILWDSHGFEKVKVPMTPEEDIEKMVKGSSKTANLINFVYNVFMKLLGKSDCPFVMDRGYDRLLSLYGDEVW